MKKRIRKKLHRKEFALFGFEIHIHCKDEENEETLDRLSNQLLELVRNYKWQCYGTLEQLFVYESFPKQGIAEGKDKFVNEVTQLPDVKDVHAHDVIDAWYGPAIECQCHCDHE